MRVTFPRLPDHQRAYALVERDDGVVYRLYGGTAGPRLPHDIMHLVVERELRIRDGIWGGIAAGVVFDSMRHVSGRRRCSPNVPPVAARLPGAWPARRTARRPGVQRRGAGPHDAEKIRRLADAKLSVLPETDVDPVVIAVAARALQVEAARWARLRVGEELCYEWPGGEPDGGPARRSSIVHGSAKREHGAMIRGPMR